MDIPGYTTDYKGNVNVGEFDDQQLWYNSHIKIQKKVVYYKTWCNKDTRYIRDLQDENCNVISFNQMCIKYGLLCNFLEYYSITSHFTIFFYMALWDSLSALNLICPVCVGDYIKKVYFIGNLL